MASLPSLPPTSHGENLPSRHEATLNSRRAACALMRLVERASPDHPQDVLPQNSFGTEQNDMTLRKRSKIITLDEHTSMTVRDITGVIREATTFLYLSGGIWISYQNSSFFSYPQQHFRYPQATRKGQRPSIEISGYWKFVNTVSYHVLYGW
ncbi:hypothetical protein TNCV_1030801 [Trichonephila clavipes]|nr:hypothetical protein TNCV_1030801 [Trichonephila clavipes]